MRLSRGKTPVLMPTGESGPPPFQGRRFLLPVAYPNGNTFEPFDPFTPDTRGPWPFTDYRRGGDFHPARRGEIHLRHGKHEPETEPIISDAAARFTKVLFLALFTIGAVLLIWRGLRSVPEGDHWIDQVMGAIRAFSTFAAMLLVLYLVFAARVYAERTEEQLRLRFQHGLAEGRQQAAQRFGQEATGVWKAWTEWKELAETARMEGRPEPEPPTRPGNPGN